MNSSRPTAIPEQISNRIRFLLEILDAVNDVWPRNYPVFVRISATDWVENGWTIEDSVKLATVLKSKGIDLIDCSTGGNVPHVKIPLVPLYQVPFAERIKKETGILTGAVGLITTPAEAQSIVSEGKADLVFMARELLRNPYFPLQASAELDSNIPWPVQYERAKKKKG
jgi:2,4-dienoyl-CoA reductase-like NADH-dependent reductase (Old Yellow Enzyme family)